VPLAPRPVLAVALALAALLGALLVGSPVASAQTRYRTLLPTTARESNTAVWTVGPTAAGLAEGVALRSASSVVRTADFGRPASRVSSAGELFFAVDDAFIYRGSYGDAFVDVSYYDKGFGFFYLVYDATASRSQQSFGPTTNYQSNNVVYLHDSGSWKTYRFNLANVYFGNRLLNAADFKIVQPQGGSAALGNAGYLLRVDRVSVTRSATPLDRTGSFEGNYSGYGDPSSVWTRLGANVERGHGLYQDEALAATTAIASGGRRATSGAIYFDVNDRYLYDGSAGGAPVGEIVVGVEYLDAGSGSFSLVYDAPDGERTAGSVQLTNSNAWRRAAFDAHGGRFGNGVRGADFRVVSPARDLVVRDVFVTRSAAGNAREPVPYGFSRAQRLVGTYYFPVFDGYRPSLWPTSTMGPPGAGANHVDNGYSYRSIETARKDMVDMRDAGIDFTLLWYTGNTIDANTQGVVAVRQAVAAAAAVSGAPKFGLLLDSVMLVGDPNLRVRDTLLDLGDAATQAQLFRLAEDFYGLVPRSQWATIEGHPIVAVYYQGPDMVSNLDRSVIARLSDRFQAVHGVRPYLMLDRLWDPDEQYGLPVDDWFHWGASLAPAAQPGYFQDRVAAIGPGFLDPSGRSRDREGGAYYTRGWDRAIAADKRIVLIDTWNYFVEGTAIAESKEYARQYIDITRAKAAELHGRR
jgi:hypothetical protein